VSSKATDSTERADVRFRTAGNRALLIPCRCRRDSGSLKNVAQRGDRGVGCGTHAGLTRKIQFVLAAMVGVINVVIYALVWRRR
jgi:hypothetical protein